MRTGASTSAEWGTIKVDSPTPKGAEPPRDRAPHDAASKAQPGRSSKNEAQENPPYRIGIDLGSKTIKVVAIDETGRTVHSLYHRHRSDVLTTLAEAVHEFAWRYGDLVAPVAITGSAGIGLAEALDMPFVQEVIATTRAVRERHPQADCIIELGGEDAKVVYLTGGLEQHMNATCAGGTGDFIDGIAGMLKVRTRDFSKLAFGARRSYPIASRCAVFAQTDVRPLLSAGASRADIALSACKAVVKQTIGGLACGRPIAGTVVFLGGPLNYIPALEQEFRKALGLTRQTGIRPRDAHLYTAAGAAMMAEDSCEIALSDLERLIRSCPNISDDLGHLPPLFENDAERASFAARHDNEGVRKATGACKADEVFLGFDCGSTTIKYAIVDADGGLITSDYQHVEGDVLKVAQKMFEAALQSVESAKLAGLNRRIAHATVTGYGERLLSAAFGFDSCVVETVAHLRAAQEFRPDVSFVLDIGGQDMKALWVRDGVVVDAVLNEACSSGCGAFVQSATRSLAMSSGRFSTEALAATRPIDLGAKCTVFMTSRVRHAQKIGASRGDIAAGIAYSVVNNALTRIIGAERASSMGDVAVVQGGTFKSDAVLRAFEKVTGKQVVRPKEAHLMGAYGAALIARDRYVAQVDKPFMDFVSSGDSEGGLSPACPDSSLVSLDELRTFDPKRKTLRCSGCGNACLLSVVEFCDGKRYISGNRCERAEHVMFGAPAPSTRKAPNAVVAEQGSIARFGGVRSDGPRGAVAVGILNVLFMYENMPFWHTLFRHLGFSVLVADDDAAARYADEAAASVPSESVCQPAKLAHLRYACLAHAGADAIFMPRYERGSRCPVTSGYAAALQDSTGDGLLVSPVLRSSEPKGIAKRPEDQALLFRALSDMAPASAPLSRDEFGGALAAALSAQSDFDAAVEKATMQALEWIAADETRRGAVLVGRPYHMDPALLHGIDQELNKLGFAVVPALGVARMQRACRSYDPLWMGSRHLAGIVEFAASVPRLEVVALRAFGCGYDAVAFDEAREVAETLNRPFTELKIDNMSNNAHIRVRLRTLAEAADSKHFQQLRRATARLGLGDVARHVAAHPGSVTPDLCSTAKELVRRVASAVGGTTPPYTVKIPFVCQDCLVGALPFELRHIVGYEPSIRTMMSASSQAGQQQTEHDAAMRSKSDLPRVGLVGNPFLVFDEEMNEGIVALLVRLGCEVVMPEAHLLEVDDVRYIPQLERFYQAGVDHVIYLQSFGCLKGHVQSRGALRELAARFPDMPITVIDYDPESSALNRENRIRLAAQAAFERRA